MCSDGAFSVLAFKISVCEILVFGACDMRCYKVL